ncbi:hypothetical protein BT93_J0093 [Corymbia citriodora subsp. variegata]|nr:hypothetical protein BT93_J0093 [Corymbia citriodora subsp. variegata]
MGFIFFLGAKTIRNILERSRCSALHHEARRGKPPPASGRRRRRLSAALLSSPARGRRAGSSSAGQFVQSRSAHQSLWHSIRIAKKDNQLLVFDYAMMVLCVS